MKSLKFETMEAAIKSEHAEWEDIADGRAVVVLPDGTKWGRVRPRGLSEYDNRYERFIVRHEENEHRRFIQQNASHLLTEQRAERLDKLLDQMNPDGAYDRMASVSEASPIHDIFVNVAAFEPRRFFCSECGWFDPTEDEHHPREDDPFAEDPSIIAPGSKKLQ